VSRSSFIVGPAGRKVGLLGDWWRWGKLAVVVLIFLEGEFCTMALNNFQDLIAWQKSMKLVLEVYRLVKYLPQAELYGLSNQMRRAAVSIPSNIAEGTSQRND
jgi:hypothetical protein